MLEACLKASSKAQNHSKVWIISQTAEDIGQFSAGLFNKAVPHFFDRKRLKEYVKAGGGHF